MFTNVQFILSIIFKIIAAYSATVTKPITNMVAHETGAYFGFLLVLRE